MNAADILQDKRADPWKGTHLSISRLCKWVRRWRAKMPRGRREWYLGLPKRRRERNSK